MKTQKGRIEGDLIFGLCVQLCNNFIRTMQQRRQQRDIMSECFYRGLYHVLSPATGRSLPVQGVSSGYRYWLRMVDRTQWCENQRFRITHSIFLTPDTCGTIVYIRRIEIHDVWALENTIDQTLVCNFQSYTLSLLHLHNLQYEYETWNNKQQLYNHSCIAFCACQLANILLRVMGPWDCPDVTRRQCPRTLSMRAHTK